MSGNNPEYQRGYQAGMRKAWNPYAPILPPHAETAEMIAAANNLCEQVEGQLATFDEDDPMTVELAPHLQRVYAAIFAINEWQATAPEKSP